MALNTGEYNFIYFEETQQMQFSTSPVKSMLVNKREQNLVIKKIINFLSIAMLKSYAKRPLKTSWFDPVWFLVSLFFNSI